MRDCAVSLAVSLATVFCWGLVGCGASSDRKSIEGTVTFDSQPVTKGSIAFLPLPGTASPTAGGDILDGQFAIPDERSVYAGKFRVEITASRPTGRKITHPLTGALIDETQQYLPEKFNRESELEVEVQANGTNRFDFSLASPQPARAHGN